MGAYSRLVALLTAAQSAATLSLVQPTRASHLENRDPHRPHAEGPGSDTTRRFGAAGLPEWLVSPSSLDKRATTCVSGANYCFKDPTQACLQCGACCANGKCAVNFGSCCSDDSTVCAYGYACCASASGPSKCCYAGTSFCCPTADGCCMNGQTCGKNGCEGTASFVVQSVTTTTTLYTTNYTATITTTSTAFSTFLQTSMQLLTTNVTSGGVATATSTVYVKSTRVIKRAVPEPATPAAAPTVVPDGGPPARPESSEPLPLTATPASPVSAAIHDGLAAMGLVRKRTVTSVVYTYSFVWVGVPAATTITKLVVLPATSLVNSASTVTNTIFSDASITVTVTSTITVDVAAAATVSAVLEATLQAIAASSDQIKAPDPTAATSGTRPAAGAGSAATGAPGGDGFDSASQGTSPTAGGGGPGSNGGGARGNGTTESAPPAAPLPELGAVAKAWIGAGAAVAGLAFLGLALVLIRRHRANSSYSSTPVAGLVIGSPKLMTSMEAGPPYGTGSSTVENNGSWMLPVQLPPPPPPPPPPPVPPRHPDNKMGGFPAWLTEAAASTSAISLGGLARHVSDVGANARQSAYSVSDYGASYDSGTALPPPPPPPASGARQDTVDLGLRRWTVEVDSVESLRDSERTFAAGPVYDPARYMEEAPAGDSRELLEAPGQSRPLLGSYGR